jgi:hypothetical protein
MPFSDADILFVYLYGKRGKENFDNTGENGESAGPEIELGET